MESLDFSRPLSRRSEDSGVALSIGSSRGSSPIDSDCSPLPPSVNPMVKIQRSKSNVSNHGLKKKPLFRRQETNVESKYKNLKSITMEVKKSSYGRKGWIAKPVDPSLEIGQLSLTGALEKLANDLRVMELSGKDVPKFVTITLE